MKKILIELEIDEEMEKAIEEILKARKEEDKDLPELTPEQAMQVWMGLWIRDYAWARIAFYQAVNGLITLDEYERRKL